MRSYEIIGSAAPELTNEILQYLLDHEKAVYRAMIQGIANQRKLRPVFIERKPRAERHIWLRQALGRKPADELAAQVLQIWLLGSKADLICAFLDALDIKHDGKGVVETLPSDPGKEKLIPAIDSLLSKYPESTLTVYLHAFQNMDDAKWPSLEEILASDPRLRLGPSDSIKPVQPEQAQS
ncbi:MAG: hypothetical protein JO308_07700 [Verrucomicrobia bacterium]|nr:hypothetical protein [Verrucomicrobiota bacterium]